VDELCAGTANRRKKVKGKRKKLGGNKTPQDIRERTFQFALRIIKLCNELNKMPGVCRDISGQLLKAGTSVGANTEEAQAAQRKPDFISKNSIALKEARETHYWLRLLIAAKVLSEDRLTGLLDEAEEIKRILGSIVVSAKRRQRTL
jgi:four helix bundle protein